MGYRTTNKKVFSILKGFPCTNFIKVSNWFNLQAVATGISQWSHVVRALSFIRCVLSDEMITCIVRNCPLLAKLDLTNSCQDITDVSILALSKHSHNLQTLICNDAWAISDTSIVSLASHCKLSTVNFGGCSYLSDSSLVALQTNCSLHLTHINFSRCTYLTKYAINEIAKCKLLQAVDLGGCDICKPNDALKLLGHSCPFLSNVNLSKCWNLSDESVILLARNCKELQIINCSWCIGLTTAIISPILKHCIKLKIANFMYIPKFNPKFLISNRKELKNCSFIY